MLKLFNFYSHLEFCLDLNISILLAKLFKVQENYFLSNRKIVVINPVPILFHLNPQKMIGFEKNGSKKDISLAS